MNEQIYGKTYYRITYPWRDDDGKEYIVERVFDTAEDAFAYADSWGQNLFVDPRKFGTPYVVKQTEEKEERKTGKWIRGKHSLWHIANCSVCGECSTDVGKYCPNCGAKMEVDE